MSNIEPEALFDEHELEYEAVRRFSVRWIYQSSFDVYATPAPIEKTIIYFTRQTECGLRHLCGYWEWTRPYETKWLNG